MCRQFRKRSDGGRGRQQLSIEEMMSTCSITPHEAENLIKKIDGFESRLMALESRSTSTYFPEVIISSVDKIVENFLLKNFWKEIKTNIQHTTFKKSLIKKIDGFESRLMALESRSTSTYFPEVIISSVNKIVENTLLLTVYRKSSNKTVSE